MLTVVIAVRNTVDGQTALHHIYNQSEPWDEMRAREWCARNEYDPWEYASHSHE
jgi:hypothetical protein